MIRIHFSIKRKEGKNREELGRIASIGLHFINQPDILDGVIRHTNLKADTFNRLQNRQVVITPDGLGTIQNYSPERDENDKLILPSGVNVRVRNLNKNKIYYSLSSLYVVDIIESKSGIKYPATESDYPLLLIDDAPVEFVLNLSRIAELTISSRRRFACIKPFARGQSGIKILHELIEKKVWNPIKK